MKTIAIIASLLALTGVAKANTADSLDVQYTYCHWLAETNRTDAIRRGLDDHDVQLAYEDTFDFCSAMTPVEFVEAAGVTQ